MPCGSEHPTRENQAPALYARLRTQHQLRAISMQFFLMVRDKEIAQLKKKHAFVLKYNTWVRQVLARKIQLNTLFIKQKAGPSSVSMADWNALVQGSEHKICAFLRLPRSRWAGGTNPLNGASLKSIIHLKEMRYEITRKAIANRINKAMEGVQTSMWRANKDEASVTSEEWEAALDTVKTFMRPCLLESFMGLG